MASITKRGKSYLIQVSMPDGQGGYVRKSSTYKPPLGSTPTQARRGAETYAIEFEQKCNGLLNFDENMTLDELQKWYMSDIAPNRLKRSDCGRKHPLLPVLHSAGAWVVYVKETHARCA